MCHVPSIKEVYSSVYLVHHSKEALRLERSVYKSLALEIILDLLSSKTRGVETNTPNMQPLKR